MKATDGHRGFGHLHQGERPLLHAGAPRGRDQDQGKSRNRRLFRGADYFFADHGAHAPPHEVELEHAVNDGPAVHPAFAQHDRVLVARFFLAGLEPVPVFLRILEVQRVHRVDAAFPLLKGAFVQQQLQPLFGSDGKVIIAFWTDPKITLQLLAVYDLPTVVALDPQAFGYPDPPRLALLPFGPLTVPFALLKPTHLRAPPFLLPAGTSLR